MVKSMTGYGRGQAIVGTKDVTVEIRSVNHRFFEFSAKMPRAYSYLEEKLKAYVKTAISRGKVDVCVTVASAEGSAATQVKVNRELARSYVNALHAIADELQIKDDVAVSQLARFPDIFTVTKAADNEEETWQAVQQAAEEAVANFIQMRQAEGEKMEQDLLCHLKLVEDYVKQVETLAPKTVEHYHARLMAKLQEILGNKTLDQQRIVTEAAIFADRIAVSEEMVRLGSHIRQFRDILNSQEPMGRKLDFLVQEFNREANTIGSKAQDVEIAKIVVEMKSEIEKIREQIQNIE